MTIAIIHNVRSIHNVASMFRTADGAGIAKLYLTGFTPSPVDEFGKFRPAFTKVSLGAERTVSWEHCRSATPTIKRLQIEGYTVVAIEQSSGSRPLFSYRHPRNVAFIVGNEVRGLAPGILKSVDAILEIPMRGEKESLNVSVSFGIAAYTLTG